MSYKYESPYVCLWRLHSEIADWVWMQFDKEAVEDRFLNSVIIIL